ncbi:MAG: biotin synthase BioB [Legionellales bacterium]|nr:biotin synthase BioB [Legionellales bacterium]|tara:strand:+ start:904 stop:1923 length:1020 start_codon:yes stop_codon:yes gene_type:complete
MSGQNLSWTKEKVAALFDTPLMTLLYQAQTVHLQHFEANTVQLCTLENIKAGACPEDCGYCSQSVHHNTDLEKAPLSDYDTVIAAAKAAKEKGATRFCMAAAWKSPTNRQLTQVIEMVKSVNALGLETCLSAGMLNEEKAKRLKNEAQLDYYNHNLDTSEEYYPQVATTRTYEDRLNTLDHLENAGIKVCCGGIMGLGESREDRVSFIHQLAKRETPPPSVPINRLVPIDNTPLGNVVPLDFMEFLRTIAVARITMPQSYIRLAAGRESLSDAEQTLCFFAGANSIFYGERLLTVNNKTTDADTVLFEKLGLLSEGHKKVASPCAQSIPSSISVTANVD